MLILEGICSIGSHGIMAVNYTKWQFEWGLRCNVAGGKETINFLTQYGNM